MNKILKYQGYHFVAYLLLGFILLYVTDTITVSQNQILGLTAFNLVVLSWIAGGSLHLWVLLFWRLELYFGTISKTFGKAGFTIYRIGFVIFALSSLFSTIPISMITQNSFTLPDILKYSVLGITAPFILWTLFSVARYFGIRRAFGADHFFSEYREKPLETRGIYRYVPNSMYNVALLILYYPGLLLESSIGLLTALMHHLFVWVHYFCTEKPDIKEIYKKPSG